MAEPDKQQVGEGQDNPAQAASKTADAAKQLSSKSAEMATNAGKEAVSNAAAATVQASVEGGGAVAEIATGTAAGGVWGAALGAVWASRHTLWKIIICISLILCFFITAIVSLPSIVANNIFRTDPDNVEFFDSDFYEIVDELSAAVASCVENGFDYSLAEVERIIEDGGYDYEASKEALINNGYASADYDICYILAAYSASMGQRGTKSSDMTKKLNAVSNKMFPVTYEEKSFERAIPLTYATYGSISVEVVTEKVQTGSINGEPQYRYTTAKRTYYTQTGEKTTSESIEITAYEAKTVEVPIYNNGTVTGTEEATYYSKSGKETLVPETETVLYVEATIHNFDSSVILEAFSIQPDAIYDQFNITYAEAIDYMANALKQTIYGTLNSGDIPAITDEELLEFLSNLDCSGARKELIRAGLSLVGRVPYFWGGKSAAGWNDEWNTPKLVTAAGSTSSGTIRPYGLDCSGFTDWVYKTALGHSIGAGTSNQWSNTEEISYSELLPGDLAFKGSTTSSGINHVMMYAGKDSSGNDLWIHCSSSYGVVMNSPSGLDNHYRRVTGVDLEADVISGGSAGEVAYTMRVNVTHYCPCSLCCGEYANGITASGKTASVGMVAMSSYYAFGTKLMINGTVYTVEDRGGSGIENDITRVDIFVASHQEALRLGRYWTEATFYK